MHSSQPRGHRFGCMQLACSKFASSFCHLPFSTALSHLPTPLLFEALTPALNSAIPPAFAVASASAPALAATFASAPALAVVATAPALAFAATPASAPALAVVIAPALAFARTLQGKAFAQTVYSMHSDAVRRAATLRTTDLQSVVGLVNEFTSGVREALLDGFQSMRTADDSFAQVWAAWCGGKGSKGNAWEGGDAGRLPEKPSG
eukprot:352534-Chlamydomonas_euryale.AAC.2